MKKFLIALILAGASAFASAGSVQQMVQQCHDLMICDICKVANDPKEYPNGYPISVKENGKFVQYRISQDAYRYLSTGYEKGTNDFLMCERIPVAMQDPNSDKGRMARYSFNMDYDGRGYCPKVVEKLSDKFFAWLAD